MTILQQLSALEAAERSARGGSEEEEDNQSDANRTRDSDKQKRITVVEGVPKAESLSAALQQAVRSGDAALLNLCLQEGTNL